MSDERIIFKFLKKEFKDDSVAVYLYCVGNTRSKSTAIGKALSIAKVIFKPYIDDEVIQNVIETFFEYKLKQHSLGKIEVKPIY